MTRDDEISHNLALIRQYRRAIEDTERRLRLLGYEGLT